MSKGSLVTTCVAFMALALGACQGSGSPYASTGAVTPTVAGGPKPAYTNYNDARLAFTRTSEDGTLTATLKDAAWIQYEGDPDGAAQRHRAYFQGVATAFEVVFRPKAYVRVPDEVFVLEDSTGRRMTTSPKRYEGEMTLVDDRFHFTFDLAYAHALSTDLRWLRLTHQSTGQVIEWTFGGQAPVNANAGAGAPIGAARGAN